MYEKGFQQGRDHAVLQAFGHKAHMPDFESPEDESAWFDGYYDGFDSVND